MCQIKNIFKVPCTVRTGTFLFFFNFLLNIHKIMVATRRSNRVGARRSQRRCISSSKHEKIKKTSRTKTKALFEKANDVLDSLRLEASKSKAARNDKKKDVSITDGKRSHSSLTSSSSNNRPIRKATAAALKNIGKVARYESMQSNNTCNIVGRINADADDESSYAIKDISRPKLPSMPIFANDNNEVEVRYDTAATDMHINDDNGSTITHHNEGDDVSSLILPNDYCFDEPCGYHNTKKKVLNVSNVNDIFTFFNLAKSSQSSLPSVRDREESYELKTKNNKKWTGLRGVSIKCFDQLLDTLCPGPSQALLRKDISLRIQKTCNGIENVDHKKILNRVIQTIFGCIKVSKKSSIERRILRAIIVKTLKMNMIQSYCKENSMNDISNGSVRVQINKDIPNLMNGNPLLKKEQTRSKVSDSTVRRVVAFILHRDHVVTTSWGQRMFHLSKNEYVTLPRLCRKRSHLDLWNEYTSICNLDENCTQMIGKRSFYYIVNDLTTSNKVIINAVDYVQALLVAEPIEVMQDIVESMVHISKRDKLTKYLAATATFLKYRYNHHAKQVSDDCCTHDPKYILGRKSNFDDSVRTRDKNGITCPQCKFPFFVCYKIKEAIIENESEMTNNTTAILNSDFYTNKRNDALRVIKECGRKFQLFMGHRSRCTNQNAAIDDIDDRMKTECINGNEKGMTALMIGDFKMKFEPISTRETSLDHFGKRGISWHGFCIQFYLLIEETSEDGTTVERPTKYTAYLDQIISDSNKQDSFCVFSLLEAALAQINNELPFITSIILQTDNAKSYNNNFLLCAIPLLNKIYEPKGISIIEFLHTETQDGKTILDAHFARCMKFVKQFMSSSMTNRICKIGTARGLGYALSDKGGVTNTMVQVVNTDRDRVLQISSKFSPVLNSFKTYFTRINHVYFHKEPSSECDGGVNPTQEDIDSLKVIDNMVFKVGVQSYSNINRIVYFNIDMTEEKDKDKMIPDELVTDEINSTLRGANTNTTQNNKTGTTTNDTDNNVSNVNDISEIAASLLDLSIRDKDLDRYYDREKHANENVTFISNDPEECQHDFIMQRKRSTDDTSLMSDESSESDIESDSSDDDSSQDDLYIDIEDSSTSKRIYSDPDEEKYGKENFISNIIIEKMLNVGKLTSFDHSNDHVPKKRWKKLSSLTKKDICSTAIRMANSHIQVGNLLVTSSEMDDPILKDGEDYNLSSFFSDLQFDQGWGRRNDRFEESTLYGDTYINPYKHKLKEYFDEGVKNSSRKMNAAMMREQLKIEFPDTFSLPGDTEIKKFISLLFAKSKLSSSNESRIRTYNNDDDEQCNWKPLLKEIVEEDPSKKPEAICKDLVDKMLFRHNTGEDSLPPKDLVKRKISYFKRLVRVRAHRSIV